MSKSSTGVKIYGAEELAKLETVLNRDRAKLDMMRDEFATYRDSREGEFIEKMPTLLSEDELEAIELESDPAKIYTMLKAHEKNFVDEAIAQKQEELDAFESTLEEAQDKFDILSIESAFFSENPDLDAEGFVEFLKGKLAPDDIAEMMEAAKGDNKAYLQMAAEKFTGSTGDPSTGSGDEDDPTEGLPADLDGVPGESGDPDGDVDESEDDSAYLRAIGMA